MSHEMIGYNNENQEVAYIRFSMGNPAASFMYGFLDADDYNAGPSGTGKITMYTFEQIDKAKKSFHSFSGEIEFEKDSFALWQHEEIVEFFDQCCETAQKEKKVEILFY